MSNISAQDYVKIYNFMNSFFGPETKEVQLTKNLQLGVYSNTYVGIKNTSSTTEFNTDMFRIIRNTHNREMNTLTPNTMIAEPPTKNINVITFDSDNVVEIPEFTSFDELQFQLSTLYKNESILTFLSYLNSINNNYVVYFGSIQSISITQELLDYIDSMEE